MPLQGTVVKICGGLLLLYFQVSSALLCYSCVDIDDTEKCLNVTECAPNHVCSGKADGFDSAVVTHTLGCKSAQGPATTNEPGRTTFCDHTCREDLCNLHLCTVYKQNITRSPRCLSCNHVEDPAKCHDVKVCDQDEFCHKRSGQNPAAITVGKRLIDSTFDCSQCCTVDHCNEYVCTDTHRDAGEKTELKFMNHSGCNDSLPDICATFGLLNKDSCSIGTVLSTCPRSCDVCGQLSWSEWQTWSDCSVTCGSAGARTRNRHCVRQLDVLIAANCPGSATEAQPCGVLPDCPATTTPTTETTPTTLTPTTSTLPMPSATPATAAPITTTDTQTPTRTSTTLTPTTSTLPMPSATPATAAPITTTDTPTPTRTLSSHSATTTHTSTNQTPTNTVPSTATTHISSITATSTPTPTPTTTITSSPSTTTAPKTSGTASSSIAFTTVTPTQTNTTIRMSLTTRTIPMPTTSTPPPKTTTRTQTSTTSNPSPKTTQTTTTSNPSPKTTPMPTTSTRSPQPTTRNQTSDSFPKTTPMPTTSTPSPKTTNRTTHESTQCQVCLLGLPEALCERAHTQQTCTYPDNYCINHLVNQATGNRVVTRKCGNRHTCEHDWFLATSDNGWCTGFDSSQTSTFDFECTYCCTTDNCNAPAKIEQTRTTMEQMTIISKLVLTSKL